MRPVSATINANNEKSALDAAAQELEAAPENIRLTPAENGSYTASLINYDADIRLEIPDDGLSAVIAEYRPAQGLGRALSASSIAKAMSNYGVRIPPDPNEIKTTLADIENGKEVTGRVLVRGTPPREAVHASIEPLGDWSFPVFPGDLFGKIIPAVDAKPGRMVSGTKIPPAGDPKGKSISFPKNSGCFIDKTTFAVRAETYGLVEFEKREARVKPLLSFSSDNMEVIAVIFQQDFKHAPISPERMAAAMQYLEISGRIDRKGLTQAAAKAKETGQPVPGVVVCRGEQPKHGEDGWFEMLYRDERSSVGTETEKGRMDFRTRGVVRSVQKEEPLGVLHPPEPGVPGRDIYGRIIPAQEGEPFDLIVGENVDVSEDGVDYFAAERGMVFLAQNRLAVTDVFQTKGDVNMAVGNIAIEKGSVHVKGSILSGFSVSSPGGVLVDEVIESAFVDAGGSVQVRGGILMDRQGRVRARGDVSALFAKNALIEAQGDVIIAHEINNCIVFAAKNVIAVNGRGKIIGSTIRAGEGIEANELGTEIGVETTILLGLEQEMDKEALNKKRKIQAFLQKIYSILGSDPPKAVLERTPPEKLQAAASMLKARIKAEQILEQTEKLIDEQRKMMRQATRARIKVHKTIHPGVIINCFGAALKVDKPIAHSQLFFDPANDKIVVASL